MAEPVNIILFKSEDCAPCKVVARVLRKIVDMSAGRATLKLVDPNEHDEIASMFNVHQVPQVLLNGKVILTAKQTSALFGDLFQAQEETNVFGMEQGDLFTYLFNKIIEASIEDEKSSVERRRKMSILSVSALSKIVDDPDAITRPSLGDYVHIGYLQSIVTSLLAINPSSKYYLYNSGFLNGKIGNAQNWLIKYNPKIMDEPHSSDRFREFLEGLTRLYGGYAGGRNFAKMASSVEYEWISKSKAHLKIYGSAYAVNNFDVGQDVCSFLAGEIAGLVEPILGEKASVHETKCAGQGYGYCEFDITLGDDTNHYSYQKYSKQEFFSDTDRLRFELSLANISQNMFDSLLMKKVMRPTIGDFIHISVVQQVLLSMKFADPFNSALLSYAGQNYGRVLEDVGVISRILNHKNERLSFPMDFEKACKVLEYYLNSPGQILSRIQGDVTVEIIDDENAIFRVWESAASSGVDLRLLDESAIFPKVSETTVSRELDDFLAGFINGRLDLLVEDEVTVKEVKCQTMGHPYCEFHAELD